MKNFRACLGSRMAAVITGRREPASGVVRTSGMFRILEAQSFGAFFGLARSEVLLSRAFQAASPYSASEFQCRSREQHKKVACRKLPTCL